MWLHNSLLKSDKMGMGEEKNQQSIESHRAPRAEPAVVPLHVALVI